MNAPHGEHRILAVVGMPGSGKSVAAAIMAEQGFVTVRFGDVTELELKARGLPQNPRTERRVREDIREADGMAAFAIRSIPRIEKGLETTHVVADGLYSWEEYLLLKDRFGDRLRLLAVATSPATRYARLATRKVRPLTPEEAASRDRAEIETLNKGGPIAMADHVITNEGGLDEFRKDVLELLKDGYLG